MDPVELDRHYVAQSDDPGYQPHRLVLTAIQVERLAELVDGWISVAQDGSYEITANPPGSGLLPLVQFHYAPMPNDGRSPMQRAIEQRRNRSTGPADRRRLDRR